MKRAFVAFAMCAASLATLASCSALGGPRKLQLRHNEQQLSSGVRYEDLFLGSGEKAKLGDKLVVDYTVWLSDGTRVDSTLDRGVPIEITLGEAPVHGLDEGMIGMQVEGRRRITVPPELGYGKEGVPDMVPPNATLVFEVHVVERAKD